MNIPKEFYSAQIALHHTSLKKVKQQLAVSSTIRLLVFLAIVATIYLGYPNTQIILGAIGIGIVAFIFLVNRHTDLSYTKRKLEKLILINELELDVFDGDVSQLSSGKEFIDTTHPFSHDIDLFGDRSFFQYANRTTTEAGKAMLAHSLTANTIDVIPEKQKAIQNVSQLAEWRQDFCATASLVEVTVPIAKIQKWLDGFTPFLPKIIRMLPAIVSTISTILFVLLFLNIITLQVLVFWFFIGLGITGTQIKKINALYNDANKVKDTFEQYYKLVGKIEQTEFEATLLKEKQQ
ncbi:MAG: DNA mismatch repair protein MutS, partial [Bacteroidota bacterium]